MTDSLFPEIPGELRAARIGTCYDPITRRLLTNKIVIDPTRMTSNSLLFVQGSGELRLRANSSASKNANDTFFAMDAKAKIGSWVSVGFNMASSDSNASSSNNLNCFCSYVFKGQKLCLVDNGPEALFNSMTDEFQNAFVDLFNSKDSADFFGKYILFIQKFGHGCVTELSLTCGSAFQMNASYSDEASANLSKYGASLAIGTPWAGASAAAEYAKQVTKMDSGATMKLMASDIPADACTKDWCKTLMTKVLELGLSKLAKEPSAISPYAGTSPKAPEIPSGKPTTQKLPDKDKPDISKEMQKKLMEEDGFEGTWEEYIKAQEAMYEKLKPSVILKEALSIKENPPTYAQDNIQSEEETDFVMSASATSSWDLGGYIPYSYVVQPWAQLFPQFKSINIPTTFRSIYIAKTYMYYLTRLQFASYLSFLSDVGTETLQDPPTEFGNLIAEDAIRFHGECKKFLEHINKKISERKSFGEADYNALVQTFNGWIYSLKNFESKFLYGPFCSNLFQL